MSPAEYVQLKAFARYDGALLAVLWVASFACYVAGIAQPFYGMVALLLMVFTPFFVGLRLKKFRDVGLGGIISLGRGWGYSVYVFFYASVLLALAQYVYFAYIDQGYLMAAFHRALQSPEARQVVAQYGMQQALEESMQQFASLRPIDYALNVLTLNIMVGIVVALPISAALKRTVVAR